LFLINNGLPVRWERYRSGINVEDCPLTNPPIEIVKQGNEAILNYFAEKERAGTEKASKPK
jgi:internalin A